MKRLSFCALSVFALSLSGCCWPNLLWPWGSMNGCGSGSCPPPVTGWNTGYDPNMQAAYPIQQDAIAAQPFMPTQVAYPQQVYPTMAVEALPTYR